MLTLVAGVCRHVRRARAPAPEPGIGAAPRLPVAGPAVSLGCANPANHGRPARCWPPPNPKAGGALHCLGQAIGHSRTGPELMSGPTGLGPSQIQSAYKLAGLNGGGRTVALVDAYNDPKAASDLATYRKAYGLPACTTANGCFKQVNESGATSPLPSGDYGWAEEESLDLDAVSSACPTCHILLVEASSASTPIWPRPRTRRPRRPGWWPSPTATAARSPRRRLSTDSDYNHPGIAITVSSGDSGYGVEYPAASRYVTAVGGHDAHPGEQRTRLDRDGVVGCRQRLLGLRAQAVVAARHRMRASGRWPTCPPTPTRTPGSASTTRTTAAGPARTATT